MGHIEDLDDVPPGVEPIREQEPLGADLNVTADFRAPTFGSRADRRGRP